MSIPTNFSKLSKPLCLIIILLMLWVYQFLMFLVEVRDNICNTVLFLKALIVELGLHGPRHRYARMRTLQAGYQSSH